MAVGFGISTPEHVKQVNHTQELMFKTVYV
mgnify:CR=1 FL=1